MKLAKAISKRLKALRQAAGLSQQEVATRADLSLSLVAKMEQGKKADPRASTLLALAGALGVRPGKLLDELFPPEAPEDEALAAEAHHEGNGATGLNGHADTNGAPQPDVAVAPPGTAEEKSEKLSKKKKGKKKARKK